MLLQGSRDPCVLLERADTALKPDRIGMLRADVDPCAAPQLPVPAGSRAASGTAQRGDRRLKSHEHRHPLANLAWGAFDRDRRSRVLPTAGNLPADITNLPHEPLSAGQVQKVEQHSLSGRDPGGLSQRNLATTTGAFFSSVTHPALSIPIASGRNVAAAVSIPAS